MTATPNPWLIDQLKQADDDVVQGRYVQTSSPEEARSYLMSLVREESATWQHSSGQPQR
ncbi:MAG: hypothetical protein LBM23_04550 [Propionibacteriaceae bacterium]|jgi:hypothetical protein|nr:hypothetical protein [Propionibacteriaceae bacterium]